MNKKITVVFHSADFDGLFCREIARKFLGDLAEYIGWDFADKPLAVPDCEILYVLDLPLDKPFGFTWEKDVQDTRFFKGNVVWIDHHKSSIETHPASIPGYRIDGVAACRLAWYWFASGRAFSEPNMERYFDPLPGKKEFIDRKISEPYAVQLAGEYDIWDHRNPDAMPFQFGLRSVKAEELDWKKLLDTSLHEEISTMHPPQTSELYAEELLKVGRAIYDYQRRTDAEVCKAVSFLIEFDGLKFLAMNTTARNSQAFAAKDVPETGHDALMKFNFTGEKWDVSMYHAKHRTDLDLSVIATKYGGGGHKGACGFRISKMPFLP